MRSAIGCIIGRPGTNVSLSACFVSKLFQDTGEIVFLKLLGRSRADPTLYCAAREVSEARPAFSERALFDALQNRQTRTLLRCHRRTARRAGDRFVQQWLSSPSAPC